MLTQAQLTEALKTGQAKADTCGHYCRLGATVDAETYVLHHNHISDSKTDVQTIHAAPVLGRTADKLAERIGLWLTGLHRDGERLNLNAA